MAPARRRPTSTRPSLAVLMWACSALICSVVVPAGAASARAGTRAGTPASASAERGTYVALAPARLFDGRRDGVAAAHGTVGVAVLGHAGVPSTGVAAIALTVTATGETASGYVIAYAAGKIRPNTSNLNFAAGQDVANSVVVPAGSGGEVDLYNGSVGRTDFVVDVAGFYRSGSATVAGAFTAMTPTRWLDTRTGTGGSPPGARGTVRVNVGLTDATVLMNVTVTAPAAAGYVIAYAEGAARPATSNLNFSKGQTVANQVIVAVGASGVVDLYNASAGATQLVLDVVGRYRGGAAAEPGALQPAGPRRQLDTRTLPSGPLGARSEMTDFVDGTAGVPASGVSSLLLNVTVVAPAQSGYLRIWATGDIGTVPPPTSSLNFSAGHTVAGLVLVAAGQGGNIGLYLGSSGRSDVVVDVVGYTLDGPGASRGSITGTVDVLNVPANGLTVRVYEGMNVVASALTGADGTYTVAGLQATADGYTVCVLAPNDSIGGRCFWDLEWDGTTPAPGSTPVQVEGGTLRANVNAFLREPLPTGMITGRLTAADTGAPVAGAQVVALPGEEFSSTTTGADGTYEISGLSPGNDSVCFRPDNTAASTPPTGYANACHVGEVAVSDYHTTTGVDGAVPIGAAISGRVTAAADASPIANVGVNLQDASGHKTDGVTGADGTFSFVGLTDGVSVTVCFDGTAGRGGPSMAGYLADCYHTGAGSSPTPITLTAGSTVTGIDAALASGGGISGTVLAGSTGVSGVIIEIFRADGTPADESDEAVSNDDGTYAIPAMQPGTYLVCFAASYSEQGNYADQCYRAAFWDGGTPPSGANPVTVTADAMTTHIDAALTSN
jgi:carboxypeptidase family protein